MGKLTEAYKPRPCPWCGETPRVLERRVLDGGEELQFPYYVQCLYYGCTIRPQTGYWKYPEEAVSLWNSRCDKPKASK